MFQELAAILRSSGKVDTSEEFSDVNSHLSRLAEDTVGQSTPSDVATQAAMYGRWAAERQADVDRDLEERRVAHRKREIADRILELRAREERLRYFEMQTQIELKISERPVDPLFEEAVSEEEFVAPPGERKSEKRRR